MEYNTNYQQNGNYELGWDDEIEQEGGNFELLPDGEYQFRVTGWSRGRHEGSAKIPACNKAIVNLDIIKPDGKTVSMTENLLLYSSCEWKLSEFFISLGLKKHGEKVRMQWNAITGRMGRVKISTRKWKGKDGSDKESNQIDRFLEPAAGGTPQTWQQPNKGFTPGHF